MDTWGLRGTLAAVAVAAVIAGAGGATVYAATGGGFTSGGHGGPPPGFAPPAAPPAAVHDATPAVHAESVVSDGNGGYTVELSQTGTIIAMDAGSVTARSADGFVQRYLIPAPSAAPPFHVGDEVTIRGTRDGANATLTSVR